MTTGGTHGGRSGSLAMGDGRAGGTGAEGRGGPFLLFAVGLLVLAVAAVLLISLSRREAAVSGVRAPPPITAAERPGAGQGPSRLGPGGGPP